MKFRVVVIVGSILICGLLVIFALSQSFVQQQAAISAQFRDSLNNQARISLLMHELGYSNFIHNFKNYVQSGDDRDYAAAVENLKNLEQLFENRKTPVINQSLPSQYRLIEKTIREYQVKLELVRQLHNQGLPIQEISEQSKVNDEDASQALRDLITEYQGRAGQLLQEEAIQHRFQERAHIALVVGSIVICVAVIILCWIAYSRVLARLRVQSSISSRQKLLDAAPNPILVVAESGEIVVANQGAAKLFECDTSALIGQPVEAFVPEADREDHVGYRRLFFNSSGERTMRNPVAIATASKAIKRVEVQIGLYEFDHKRYAVVNLLDVSAVEDVQRHAAQMEQNFKVTFELAPVGIAQISLEGRFIKVNRQLSSILGYERFSLESMSLDDLTPVVERNSNRLTIKRLTSNEVDHLRFEKRFLDSKARDVWVTLTMTVYRDDHAKPEYLIAIIEDISYRKQYEEELLASEAKFKSIANHVNAVVWMSTPGIDQIMFVSNRYESIWGRPVATLLAQPRSFMDAILPEDRPKVEAQVQLHRQGVWNVNYRIRDKDDHIRYIHDEGVPVRSVKGELLFMVGMARDVTDERVAQQKLERSNKQLEQLARFDPLTMAVRRPYAISDLEECIALYRRYQTDASLIFIDLNDFKVVNDTYGHEAGDQVLVEFSKCMRKNIRQTDGFYRYAGDEFLLLLRETDAREAESFSQKLDGLLASTEIPDYEDVRITISHGAVSLGEGSVSDPNHWIKLADERMYQYKKSHKKKHTKVPNSDDSGVD